jgi:CheY-like chemotaxis protein
MTCAWWRSPKATGQQGAMAGLRVVIAEDNRDAADSMTALLELSGHEVHTAYDGEQALQLIEHLKPDIALLDISMPKVNGYAIARHLAESKNDDVVLIAVTGWGRAKDRELAKGAGFAHYFVKPVNFPALEKLLEGIPRMLRSRGG